MLETIDVLIGFSVVMLILSVIVTSLVQFVTTTLLNLKGHVLKQGVAELLMLLDKGVLDASDVDGIANYILSHSLVGKKKLFSDKRRLTSVIHREELIKLVLDFAAGADLTKADVVAQGAAPAPEGSQPQISSTFTAAIAAERALQAKLKQSLENNGIYKPGEILQKVRATMLELEKSRPELANDARQTIALLTHASSEYVAKMNAWFDQTIDRTIDTFTARTRIFTIFFSLLVALFFQVNTFDLIKRLSVDQPTRKMVVELALAHPDHFKDLAESDAERQAELRSGGVSKGNVGGDRKPPVAGDNAADAGTPESQAPDDAAAAGIDSAAADPAPPSAPIDAAASVTTTAPISSAIALKRIRDDKDLGQLVKGDLIAWPTSWQAWLGYWTSSEDAYDLLVRVIGLLLTVALLGLGAPVWYELLKNLIQLRSVVARKDDAQRLTRQTNQ